jgi:8-oxo-dGTP pyrophosphatase MutT (NUDIX family)
MGRPKPFKTPDRQEPAGQAVQCAALPWRRSPDGGLQVLIITSRETRRWVIPKGWRSQRLRSAETAAHEAFEEAGVRGKVAAAPLGVYYYEKRLKNGRSQPVLVMVFDLEVESEVTTYPERDEREKLWLAPAEAAQKVDEPQLRILLADFRP